MVEIDAVFNTDVTNTCATQGGEEGSATEGPADVAGQRAYVGALSTDHAQRQLHLLRVEGEHFYFIDAHRLCLHLLFHFVALTAQLVGSFAIDVYGTIGWRHLHHITNELRQHLVDEFAGDMARGIGHINGVLPVVARRSGPQLQRSSIFLRLVLQPLNLLRHLPRTEDEHAGCQGIEGTGMTGLHPLHPHMPRNNVAHMRQCPKTRHAIGFVDCNDSAFYEIHQSTMANE